MSMNKKITRVLLFLIIVLAFSLRVYKLGEVPPSISWDEAAVGYNAWTIANFGRDEYGKTLPLYFQSFADDKHPIHIYITAFFVKLFGLSEVTTRLPAAVFGVLNVILIFFLARILFSDETIALSSALFLAISPWNIHFSRFNHEANFALFFFMLAILLFYKYLKRGKYYLTFSVISFAISFITYHPAKILVPLVFILLNILHWKKIIQSKTSFLIPLLPIAIFAAILFFNPQLLGIARINQTSLGKEAISKTKLFKLTNNELLGRINLTYEQYTWHFQSDYLFVTGDKNPRLSSQTGEFYKIDALFLIIGLVYLIYKRSRSGLLVMGWALLAPLPSALVAEAPHAARSMFVMGSWHIISALGFAFIISFIQKPIFKITVIIVGVSILGFSLYRYLSYYYGEYATRYAIEWQYGMKQIVEYVKEHKEYEQVFMTDVRSQPYIFFLYYLKTPLPEFLNTVIYNNTISKSYNTVSIFDKYYFGGGDPIESFPYKEVLYIVTPSQYDGLRHKSDFDVKKIVYYPNGLTAFYLVSGNQ